MNETKITEIALAPELFLQTVSETVSRGEDIIIAGTGTSMRPFIQPERGDKLLLTALPERPLLPGDIVLYRRPNGQAVVHRIFRVRGERFDMLGDNQIRIEQNIPRAWILAYVKQVIRPEGSCDCDCDEARQEALRAMERRLNPPKTGRLRHYAGAVKRRLAKLRNKRSNL